MFLDAYHSFAGERVRITPEQASRFAREIAGDFNPIHDPDARRFCVPGDLLCALVLAHYGLSKRMALRFRGMVGDGVALHFPNDPGATFSIADDSGKVYLDVERGGETSRDPALVEPFIRSYAAFSGRSFPHVLQPLLVRHGVMFNPDRPLVMYDSMSLDLADLGEGEPDTELADASIEVAAKRADALLHFDIRIGDEYIGRGSKKLIISGLRPYDETRMQEVIDDYEARRAAFRRGG